jgi:cytochrome c551/c552
MLHADCGGQQAAAATADAAAAPPGVSYEAHVNAGGVAPAALPPLHPPAGHATDAKAGEGLFGSMNCDGCHGGGATGWAGPSLVDGRWRYGGADEEVFQSIYYGRPKGMPAYGGVLGADGVWMIVRYLKSQPVPAVVPTTNYEGLANATAPPPVASAAPAAIPPSGSKQPMDPRAMLAQYGCVACHAIDRKVVGPAFRDVATKYHDQPGAAQRLEERVKSGGTGAWGTIPMPPNTAVPDADLHDIVNWILTSPDVRG